MGSECIFRVGEVVRIANNDSTSSFHNQIGVVNKYNGFYNNDEYYYVTIYSSVRFWSCGFPQSELVRLGYTLDELVDAHASWLLDSYIVTRNKHSYFNTFMKKLKKIRKKYRQKVKNRK